MFSLLNLKYFLELTEDMHFQQCASRLHLTQQTLSGHIKKLETHFGSKLFKYGPPLELTLAGLMLKKHAQVLLDAERSLNTDMEVIKNTQTGTLRLGCTFARAQFLLPPILQAFAEKYPYVKLQMLEGNTPEIEYALNKQMVDVAVGYTPKGIKGITSIPLYEDPYRLVVHPSILEQYFPMHPPIYFRCYDDRIIHEILTACPLLTMKTNTTIGSFGQNYLSKHNIKPLSTLELRDVGTMLAMCYAGNGVMFCPQTFVSKSYYQFSTNHLIYPLPSHDVMPISVNYLTSLKDSKIVQAFVQLVKEALAE